MGIVCRAWFLYILGKGIETLIEIRRVAMKYKFLQKREAI